MFTKNPHNSESEKYFATDADILRKNFCFYIWKQKMWVKKTEKGFSAAENL